MSLPGTLVNGGIIQHGTTVHQNQGNPGTYTSPMTITFDSSGAESAVYKTWQTTVTYANNDLVIASDSFLYISLAAGNLAHDPTTDTTNTYWAKWTDWIRKTVYWKPPCRVASTANITLSGTQTIDGVSVVAGDRVLVTGQSTGANNGIYVCAAGAWSRAYDSRVTGDLVASSVTTVSEGTANADTYWMLTSATPTMGSTAQTWAKLATAGTSLPTGTDGQVLVYNGTTPTATTLTGDVTNTGAGVTAIGAGKVTYGMLASTAQPCFYVDLLSGSTPSATGADTFEFIVPPAADGSSATWTFVKVYFRVLNAGTSGNPTAKVQKGTAGVGAFGAGTDLHTALAITGNQSTTLETSTTTFSSGTCATGDKLRANVTVLGTGTANWQLAILARRTA